jgi:hypothetical protein
MKDLRQEFLRQVQIGYKLRLAHQPTVDVICRAGKIAHSKNCIVCTLTDYQIEQALLGFFSGLQISLPLRVYERKYLYCNWW